jgi:hypothetical protein
MAKSLNDILKRYSDVISGKNPSSTVSSLTTGDQPGVDYADKMKDTRDFIAQHSVEKFDDRVGNGPDVYQAANVKKAEMERHGHEPKPKDIKVYKKNQQVGQAENKLKEEAEELDEADLSVRTLYNKLADTYANGGNIAPHEKAITKVHGPKVFEHLKKAAKANANGNFDSEEMHFDRARNAAKNSDKIGATVGKDRSIFRKTVKEAKDNREYDYEGEMAVTKLKTIIRASEHLIKMMEPNTNLPEWVQSKIVKAEDYITTAHDYLMSEMNEEVNLEEATSISKIKQIAGPGKVTKKSPSDLSGRHHDVYLSQMINHDVYTHKGKDSVRVFKVHNKTKKVSEIKGPPLMNEETEQLDEVKWNYTNVNPSMVKTVLANHRAKGESARHIGDGRIAHTGKIDVKQYKEETELSEAKCNMSEAGKMCKVHGMKACSKDKASDEQPMYNGKKKKGKQLILDKDIQEREMTAGEKKKEESLKDKYDDSDMKAKMKKQYGAEKGEQVYFAYIRKQAMKESISDQRSSKSTASERARDKIFTAMQRKKERMEKMKEQAAPAETVIKMPSGEVGDTGRV